MCERVSTRLRFRDGAVEAVRYEDDPERSTGRFDFVDLMVRRLNLFVPDARGLWLRSLVVDALSPLQVFASEKKLERGTAKEEDGRLFLEFGNGAGWAKHE